MAPHPNGTPNWTVIPTLDVAARELFVATAGNDSWDGTFKTFQGGNVGPKASLTSTRAKMIADGRNDVGDRIGMEPGMTLPSPDGTAVIKWRGMRGASATDPFIVCPWSYLDDTVTTGDTFTINVSDGIQLFDTAGGGGAYESGANTDAMLFLDMFIDLEVNRVAATSLMGAFNILNPNGATNFVSNITLESVAIRGGSIPINLSQSGAENTSYGPFTFRNVVIYDAYGTTGISNGAYVNRIHAGGLTIDHMTIYRCGYQAGIGIGESALSHNLYLDAESPAQHTVKYLISIEADSHGLQMRPGGSDTDSLYMRNSTVFWGGSDVVEEGPNVRPVTVDDVVVWNGKDLGDGVLNTPRAFNQILGCSSCVIDNTLIYGFDGVGENVTNARALDVDDADDGTMTVEIKNSIFYDWETANVTTSGLFRVLNNTFLSSLTVTNTHFQNQNTTGTASCWSSTLDNSGLTTSAGNKFWEAGGSPGGTIMNDDGTNKTLATWMADFGDTTSTEVEVAYPDPTKTPLTYHSAVLGGDGTLASLAALMIAQRRSNWNPLLSAPVINDYCRGGFGLILTGAAAVSGGGKRSFARNAVNRVMTQITRNIQKRKDEKEIAVEAQRARQSAKFRDTLLNGPHGGF